MCFLQGIGRIFGTHWFDRRDTVRMWLLRPSNGGWHWRGYSSSCSVEVTNVHVYSHWRGHGSAHSSYVPCWIKEPKIVLSLRYKIKKWSHIYLYIMQSKLVLELCWQMLFLDALTGLDTTSRIFHIEKSRYQKLQKTCNEILWILQLGTWIYLMYLKVDLNFLRYSILA